MNKIRNLTLMLVLMVALVGCSKTSVETDYTSVEVDYPAAIMVDNLIYLLPVTPSSIEIDDGAIIGYTDSYTDTFPEHNGETNFNRELEMPYVKVEGGIAVLLDGEWYICTLKD
ncbi:MAG: hypothetical protein R3Y54_11045 [Eubacteriales bacterium]